MNGRTHFDTYDVALEPLSPVHVGSGETLEPYEYVLWCDEEHGGQLTALYLDQVLAELTPEQRKVFYSLTEGRDFVALRNWITQVADRVRHKRLELNIQPEAYAELQNGLGDPARSGEVHLFPRRADSQEPYLPGSSLKGALRTAVVAAAAAREDAARGGTLSRGARQYPNDGVPFEAEALGFAGTDGRRPDIRQDPFRRLAISDLNADYDPTYIDRIQIVKRGEARQGPGGRARTGDSRGEPGGILMYREVTWSVLEDVDLTFRGQARVYRDSKLEAAPLELDRVLRACNDFYTARLDRELARFQLNAEREGILRRQAEAIQSNQCLVRLGRYSHFECVTAGEAFATPPRRGAGASRTYVAGRLPLGWARLTFTRREPGRLR